MRRKSSPRSNSLPRKYEGPNVSTNKDANNEIPIIIHRKPNSNISHLHHTQVQVIKSTHSITKYATANWHICNKALTICWKTVGLNSKGGIFTAKAWSVSIAAIFDLCCLNKRRSYSLPSRRRNSRRMTRRTTPIQDPANIPLEVMCHDLAMKQVSTVFQFHSI